MKYVSYGVNGVVHVEELGGEPSFPIVTVGSVKICNTQFL
jgi:hypothetical protein